MYVSAVGAVQRAVDTGGRVREVADIALGGAQMTARRKDTGQPGNGGRFARRLRRSSGLDRGRSDRGFH